VNDSYLYGAYMPGGADGWAVGTKGTLLRWNGASWAIAAAGTLGDLFAVHGSGPSDVWIGGAYRSLLHSTGGSFQPPAVLPTFGSGNIYNAVTAIWSFGPSDVWIAIRDGSGAALSHWTGTTWQTTSPTGVLQVDRFWSPGPGEIWAFGGKPMRWSGTAWVDVPTASGGSGLAMWGASAGDAWLVGAAGSIQHWNGTAFEKRTSPTTQDLKAVLGKAANDIYAVGALGTILHWDGVNWTAESASTPIEFRAIAFTGTNDAQLFTDGSGILLKQRP
jgi:hypothetical protein